MKRCAWLLVPVLLTLVLCGCVPPPSLDPLEKATVAVFESSVSMIALTSDPSDYESDIDDAIAIAREKPDALYTDDEGRTRPMRQVIVDAAAKLSDSSPSTAKQLELTAETLPGGK